MTEDPKHAARPDASTLKSIRDRIDQIDNELLSCLQRRMQVVDELARAKHDALLPFRDPVREVEVVKKVRKKAEELKIAPDGVERIFRRLMEMAIERQQEHLRGLGAFPLRVAYQGIEGSYSHLAAHERYHDRAQSEYQLGLPPVRDALDEVKQGRVDLALVPTESTVAGTLAETYLLLAELGLYVVGDHVFASRHRLLTLPAVTLEQVQTVLSHPHVIAQCEPFFRSAPWIRPQPEADTAIAAQKVKDLGDPRVAAIGSEEAAKLYGLSTLSVRLSGPNSVRLFEVAREPQGFAFEGPDKCRSVMRVVLRGDEPIGTVVARLVAHGVEILRADSCVTGVPPSRSLFLEVAGHPSSPRFASALGEVERAGFTVSMLGTFPKGRTLELDRSGDEAPKAEAR